MISTQRESAVPTTDHPDVMERYRWLSKPEVVEILRLRPGMNVAEIGAGADGLILPISEAVGAAGHPFAVEASPKPLVRLREQTHGWRNVHVVEAPYQAIPLASHSCDCVLMVNLWTELADPIAVLREAARLLREDGRLALIEWTGEAGCPQTARPQLCVGEMIQLLENNAWDIHRHGDAGPCSYFLEAGVSDETVQS